MKARELFSGSFWVLVNHLAFRGCLVISTILLARSFESSSFAAYTYFQITITMIATYAAMGLGVTASRYFAELVDQEFGGGDAQVGLIWFVSIAIGSIAASLLLLAPSEWLSAGLAVPQWLLALGVFVSAMNVVPGGAVLGLEKYKEAAIISLAGGLIMLAAAFYATVSESIRFAMMGIVVSIIVTALGQSLLVVRVCGMRKIFSGFSYSYEAFKGIFIFAGPMFVVSLLSASSVWLVGRLILSATDDFQFSLYSIGMQWYALGMLMPGVLSRVVFPRLVRNSNLKDVGNLRKSSKLVRMTGAVSLVLAIVMLLVILVLFPWLAEVYGNQYKSHGWLFVLFSVAVIFSAPVNTLGNALVANDGQVLWLLFTIVSTAVLVGTCAFTSYSGALSGAVSLILSSLTLCMLAIFALRNRRLI